MMAAASCQVAAGVSIVSLTASRVHHCDKGLLIPVSGRARCKNGLLFFGSLSSLSFKSRQLLWSAVGSEFRYRKVTQVNAISEVVESCGSTLRVEHKSSADVQNSSDERSSTHMTRTFQGVTTEEELLNGVRYESDAKGLPARASSGMIELYYNYRDALIGSGLVNAQDAAVEIMATVLDRIILQFEEPFSFPPYHKRMLTPYDYYTFGQNYIRPLVKFRNSYLGNSCIFDEIVSRVKQVLTSLTQDLSGTIRAGHNVILFSNHQTEADPAVIALLLESSHPFLAENLTYIAGDRVVHDPFCKPFSMGRNLLCVYSKKHINDVPELVEMKRRANSRTLREMRVLLKQGGQLIWIAPSGGRDRPDPETDEWKPAKFDGSAVENMRRLLSHMPSPGHMYPIALLCHDIMPPPRQVEKEIGERRILGYTGVGLSVASELSFEEASDGTNSKCEARDRFSERVWEVVNEQYSVLNSAILGGKGLGASTSWVQLSQPWLEGCSQPPS